MARRDEHTEPAFDFLFQLHPPVTPCDEPASANPRGLVLRAGEQPLHRLTRREELTLHAADVTALTITSDPYNSITVLGGGALDWSIRFCAQAEGATELEARERLEQTSMSRRGSTVSLTGPGLYDGFHRRGDLVVDAPSNAGVVIHASYAAVEVRDMAGPVRIAATHARARIFNSTGHVDVIAGAVDFAGASGRVIISAEQDTSLKITNTRFDGMLFAWAQRSVRVLVPRGFTTPIRAVVSHRDECLCRTEFAAEMIHRRQEDLHVFTRGPAEGTPGPLLDLRSEEGRVLIDLSKSEP
jgi:hypothetical protein